MQVHVHAHNTHSINLKTGLLETFPMSSMEINFVLLSLVILMPLSLSIVDKKYQLTYYIFYITAYDKVDDEK